MEPRDEKTLEIARRTRRNLDFMDDQARQGAKVFEFTQLFNSVLGMIVCVREDYYKSVSGSNVPSVEWTDLTQWKELTPSAALREKANSFSALISNVRHAFAHSNYDFIINSQGKIAGVRVWTDKGNNLWSTNLSEEQLRELAFLAVGYLELSFGFELNSDPEFPI